MKTIAIATSLVAVLLALSVSQTRCGGTKTKTVSAATIANLPPGKTFEIDLTREGILYKFDDPGTDFSRVTIRTTAGVRSFADLLKTSNTSLRGGLVLGTPADMRDHLPPSTGGTVAAPDCGGFVCSCKGGDECIDMILSGKCGGEMWCSEDFNRCFCIAKS